MREPVIPYPEQVFALVPVGGFDAAMQSVILNMVSDEISYADGIRTISAICWKFIGNYGLAYQNVFRKRLPQAGAGSPAPEPEPVRVRDTMTNDELFNRITKRG